MTKTCPNCGSTNLESGVILDCMTGQKGYGCNSCNYSYPAHKVEK